MSIAGQLPKNDEFAAFFSRAIRVAYLVELLNLALMFVAKQFSFGFLAMLANTVFFPIAAGTSLIHASLVWRLAHSGNYSTYNVVDAVVETIAALTTTMAAVMTLAIKAELVALAPFIFTAALAQKSVYNLSLAVYCGFNAYFSTDDYNKRVLMQQAKNLAVSACLSILATVASALVLIANKASFGILGMLVVGGMGAKAYFTYSERPVQAPTRVAPDINDLAIAISVSPEPTQAPAPLQRSTTNYLRGLFNFQKYIEDPVEKQALLKIKAAIDAERQAISIDMCKLFCLIKTNKGIDSWRQYDSSHGYTHTFNIECWKHWVSQHHNEEERAEITAKIVELESKLMLHNRRIESHGVILGSDSMSQAYAAEQSQKSQTDAENERRQKIYDKTGLDPELIVGVLDQATKYRY